MIRDGIVICPRNWELRIADQISCCFWGVCSLQSGGLSVDLGEPFLVSWARDGSAGDW